MSNYSKQNNTDRNAGFAGTRELSRRGFLKRAGALSTLPLGLGLTHSSSSVAASSYPAKPIRMVHAFAAGSGTDVTGRILSEGLTRILGQSVVVENKPGASMMIGTGHAAKQPADGYTTLMVTLDSMGLNPYLYPNITYSVSDFDPITLVGQIPLVLVGSPNLEHDTFEGLVKASRDTNRSFTLGTWGYGSVGHVVGAMIAQQTGLKLEFIPFAGAAPSTQAVMGSHVDLAIITPQSAIETVKSGMAKAIATGGETRQPDIPETPTFKELGYPDLRAMQWHGFSARAGGDAAIIDKLYSSCLTIFKDPDLAAKILQVGYTELDGRSPKEFSEFIAAESAAWGDVAKSLGPAA